MARQERKYHYIYKITCNATNRYYIGMHSTNNIDDGYFGSGKRLWFSINYHGKENHVKEILEWLPTRQLLKEREKEIVTKELLDDVMCMNLQEGGGGGFLNEEHMMKCSRAGHKGFKEKLNTDNEFREKIQSNGSVSFKKYHKLGIHNYKTFIGKIHSEKTKKLISDKAKERVGEKNSQYGTCWIMKNEINKKIKKDDLEKYLNEGWTQGRKNN